MKIKEYLEHIVFGLVIMAIFGLLAFFILLLPIFSERTIILEKQIRIIVFCLFLLGLFIGGINFSFKYEKENEIIISE